MSLHLKNIVCLQCQHTMSPDVMQTTCSKCGSPWLDARYEYETVRPIWQKSLHHRPTNLWRYQELLPIQPTYPEIPMGEGYTPLTRLLQYEKHYHHQQAIYVKDERAQPTNSFKDRQASLAVMALKQAGITEVALASTGNAAVAYAAYCARAGIRLWLFLTSLVPQEKLREAAIYGCEVIRVSGTYDETKKVAADFARYKNIHFDGGAKAIAGKESMKTLAFEIAEQLAQINNPGNTTFWQAPDWYIQAVSGGIGPLGVWKGFSELMQMGLIDKMPKLGIIQAQGCAPMVNAFHQNQEQATPIVPNTLITVLATGDPGYSYVQLREACNSNGGTMLAVEDGEAFQALRRAASLGGLSIEPATAVAFAGLEKMLQDGTIASHETVVINCSGHTFPVESHILQAQYQQAILNLDLPQSEQKNTHTADGIHAAIARIDEQVTTIVIVDDDEQDRRLMRRLLQSHRQYRIYEAEGGKDALNVIRERRPDLIITDLFMPDVDGFSLVAQIKQNEQFAHIPVIMISAKDLTYTEREKLDTYQVPFVDKASARQDANIVQHISQILGHEPLSVIQPAPPSSDEPANPSAQATILIIDDNPYDLRLAKKILQSGVHQYHIITLTTGLEGLDVIHAQQPDLVILDLKLPDMDGFDIINRLQQDEKLKKIPILIYSAYEPTPEEKKQWYEYIKKLMPKTDITRQAFLNAVQRELYDDENPDTV